VGFLVGFIVFFYVDFLTKKTRGFFWLGIFYNNPDFYRQYLKIIWSVIVSSWTNTGLRPRCLPTAVVANWLYLFVSVVRKRKLFYLVKFQVRLG